MNQNQPKKVDHRREIEDPAQDPNHQLHHEGVVRRRRRKIENELLIETNISL